MGWVPGCGGVPSYSLPVLLGHGWLRVGSVWALNELAPALWEGLARADTHGLSVLIDRAHNLSPLLTFFCLTFTYLGPILGKGP